MLNDFVNVIALPEYQNLQVKATALNTAVQALNANPTDANLAAAQQHGEIAAPHGKHVKAFYSAR